MMIEFSKKKSILRSEVEKRKKVRVWVNNTMFETRFSIDCYLRKKMEVKENPVILLKIVL